jgi:HAD superfamily hydrolase (TIGR01509 family)
MNLARFAAVIFDMDGVLVDGEPLHFRAASALFAEEGKVHSLEEHQKHMGTAGNWTEIIAAYGLGRDPAYYAPRYHELIMAEYETCREPLPGAAELVERLRMAGTPIAVASSSRREWVQRCLERIGLLRHFGAVVTASDVRRGKPAPDLYELAAERLGVEAVRCLALEDAPAGIAAARAAGMTCWAVRTEYTLGLDLPGAERILGSLLELQPGELNEVAR